MKPFAPGRFLPSAGSLGDRTLRAGGLSLVHVFASHGLRLASNLIMTRLLVPEAFGLMAMVMTIITALTLISDIGVETSIVREPDGDRTQFLRVAWVIKILRSSFVAGGVCLAALLVGLLGPRFAAPDTIYADPRLAWLIALSAISPLLSGVESTNKELARRRLQLGRLTALELGVQILAIVAMISFAQIDASVWALMAGMLTGSVIKCAASHVVYQGPSMRFAWDREIIDRLWRYGRWLIGSSAFGFVAMNADRIILGALMNASSFGIYAIARIWIDAGRQVVQRLNGMVGFSSISEVLRDRPKDAPRIFRKFQTLIDILCVLSFIMLFALGRPIIDLLYTDIYAQAGAHLKILSIGLLVMRFDPLNGLILNLGNSRAVMNIIALRAIALCTFLPLALDAFGMTGALYAVALSPLVSVPYTLWVLRAWLGRQVAIDIAWGFAILLFAALYAVFG